MYIDYGVPVWNDGDIDIAPEKVYRDGIPCDKHVVFRRQTFDFTKELLDKIRKSGADYLFMTNHSSKSVSAYIEKLQRLGIKAVRTTPN